MTDERRPGLTQDYLADRLSDFERAAFEKRLASDAALVQDLEVSLRFREGLAHLRDRGDLQSLIRPGRLPYRAVLGPLAAALVITLILYAVYPHRSPVIMAASLSSLTPPATAPLTVEASYTFARMRSAVDVPTFPLPATGALELRVLTNGNGIGTFRVLLKPNLPGHDTSRIGIVSHVLPDAEGFVAIYVSAPILKPGSYSISVESEKNGSSTREQFEFQLQRRDSLAAISH